MSLEKLSYKPEQDGYNLTYRSGVIATELDGGDSRQRLDFAGKASRLNCSWLLDKADHELFMTFYRTTLVEGSLPFRIDLLVDGADLTEHNAKFVPNTLRLGGVEGNARRVFATLEVTVASNSSSSLGAALYVPAATSDYFQWDMRATADAASSNTGLFYPQTPDSVWQLGTQGNSGTSSEWAFSSGAFQWIKSGNKGLQCLSSSGTGFRFRYNNSNVTPLIEKLWAGNIFHVTEFVLADFQQGGASNNQRGHLLSAPYSPQTRSVDFGINTDDSLFIDVAGSSGSDSISSAGTYTLTTPFTGHIAFVIDGSTNNAYIFVNGVQVYTDSLTVPTTYETTSYDSRPHLGINSPGSGQVPPTDTTYMWWNHYKFASGDAPSDWATSIILNNHTYLQTQIGY